MKQKVSAIANGTDIMFEGVMMGQGGGGNPRELRKWFDAYKKPGPWVCPVCQGSVGEDGERVVVYIDLADRNCFQVFHRMHAD